MVACCAFSSLLFAFARSAVTLVSQHSPGTDHLIISPPPPYLTSSPPPPRYLKSQPATYRYKISGVAGLLRNSYPNPVIDDYVASPHGLLQVGHPQPC
jgi:hypothetical protein